MPPISRPPLRHGITLIDLVAVNLYPFVEGGGQPGDALRRADRRDRHRRAEPGARRGEELRRRAGGGLAVRLRHRAGAARSAGGPVAGVPVRSGAQGVRAHRRLRHGDCLRARHVRSTTAGSPAAAMQGYPASITLGLRKRRRSSLRREPASARRLVCRTNRRSASAARRCCRARSSRTPTCSISTRRCASCSSSTSRRRPFIKHTNPCGAAIGSRASRRVRARARSRSALGVRRRRRPQPSDRCRDRQGDRVDEDRLRDRAVGR